MFDRLPPLQTLRAFEAAGRLLSMTRAAAELHLTHGAVSRHVATLERDLGTPLFVRLTRRIVLTEAGADLHALVARLLGELASEAQRLRGEERGRRLRISTSVSFASLRLPAERGYDLVYRIGERDDPRIGALRAWLRREIRAFRPRRHSV